MNAEEWLDIYDSQLGGFFATDYEKYAATIIRSQQDRIERLTAKLKEREGEVERIRKTYDSQMDILRKRVESLLLDKEFLTSNVNHAESLAAARLIELNGIKDREASKVAGVCYQIACGCAYGYTAAKEIRETYKVSIE